MYSHCGRIDVRTRISALGGALVCKTRNRWKSGSAFAAVIHRLAPKIVPALAVVCVSASALWATADPRPPEACPGFADQGHIVAIRYQPLAIL